MQKKAAEQLFVVVGLLDELDVGATFNRREWPAHVTLASNFAVGVPGELVTHAVSDACAAHSPLSAQFSGRAMFGRDENVPVHLVDSAEVRELHERLADRLEILPGFAADEPDYWRAGYRPHLTDVPTVAVHEGDVKHIACVAVAALSESTATVIATLAHSRTPGSI